MAIGYTRAKGKESQSCTEYQPSQKAIAMS
jgi:hypothetical protein